MDGWVGGWMDGWMEVKAGLRIAYSNQKTDGCIILNYRQTCFAFTKTISNKISKY